MEYHDSIWARAPEGAEYWGPFRGGSFYSGSVDVGWYVWAPRLDGKPFWETQYLGKVQIEGTLHERPIAYRTATQLIEAYRKEHGAEIEADAETADWIGPGIKLDELLDSAVFFTVLIEKHLAAERKRIEESET